MMLLSVIMGLCFFCIWYTLGRPGRTDFALGCMVLFAVWGLCQDIMGKEAYLVWVDKHWIESPWIIAMYVVAILIGVLALCGRCVKSQGGKEDASDR
jgi:hypothetical protein